MHRPTFFTALATLGITGIFAACTQDFGQFEPSGDVTGSGGGATTSSSTTSTSDGGGLPGSATTTTTTASTGSGGSGGNGGAGGLEPEDCVNGVDDTGNDLVDCADPTCTATHECVTKPSGNNWKGPGILFLDDATLLPACPEEFPTVLAEGFADLDPDQPAMCTACACGNPTVACAAQPLQTHSGATCEDADPGMLAQTTNCQSGLNTPYGKVGAAVGSVTAPCAPSGGAVTKPAPIWNTAARLCGGPLGGGCGNGHCAAKPEAPFSAICVARDGDQTCPTGYPDKHVLSNDVNDNRTCTACSCGDATTSCTVGQTTTGSNNNCGATTTPVPHNGSCVALAGRASYRITTQPVGSGTCAPDGGMPGGTIAPGNSKTTFCCVQ